MSRTSRNEECKTNVGSAFHDQESSKNVGGQEIGGVSQPFELNWPKSFITDTSKVVRMSGMNDATHTNSREESRVAGKASRMPVKVRMKQFHFYANLEIKNFGTYLFWGRESLGNSPPLRLLFRNAKRNHAPDFPLELYFEMNRTADKSSPLHRPPKMQVEEYPHIHAPTRKLFFPEKVSLKHRPLVWHTPIKL